MGDYIGRIKFHEKVNFFYSQYDYNPLNISYIRSRETPFIGYVVAGNKSSDQITWYTSLMYSMHGPDIAPNPEIVMA